MLAVTYHHYGPPEVLSVEERPRPSRPANRVLIRVAATGVNPIDYRMRRGDMRWLLPGGFPRVPGFDVAGWVEEADEEAGFSAGDRVLAFLDNVRGGGYAEFAVTSASTVVVISDALDFIAAAGLPLAGSTVLQAMRGGVELRQGDAVLINGASGGVGSLAVQIAKAYGAEVTGVASDPHLDFVRKLGADNTIDYRTTDITTLDSKWQIVFDVAGKLSYGAACKILAPGGRFISTEPSAKGFLMSATSTVLNKRGRVVVVRPRLANLEELVRLVAAGQLTVSVDQVLALQDAAAAHRQLEAGGVCGKLILRVPDSNS